WVSVVCDARETFLRFNPVASFASINSATTERSASHREVDDDVVIEADGAMELAFENAFLIAVRAESFRAVLRIERRTDPITLHPLRAQIRHVGRARAHRRQRDRVVVLFDVGLER